MVNLADIARAVGDPDGVDMAIRLQRAYVASVDASVLPELEAELAAYLDAGDEFGRDLMCDAIAQLGGAAALEPLLRAASRDLGDDQDTLSSLITGLIEMHREQARVVVSALLSQPDAPTRDVAQWAMEYVDHR